MFNPFKRKKDHSRALLIVLLSDFAVKKLIVEFLYESTPEILRVLGRHDPIEGPILNLWVMTTAFMVGAQQLPQPQRDAILDDFHLQSYGTLLKSGGMTESQIMDMQKRLRQREC